LARPSSVSMKICRLANFLNPESYLELLDKLINFAYTIKVKRINNNANLRINKDNEVVAWQQHLNWYVRNAK
jgi:hypothetical protein